MTDVVEAMCQVPGCGHREPVSLNAWLHGEQFKHCDLQMRVHVADQATAEAAIERAMEEGVERHAIIARLSGGITDIDPDALKPQRQSAGETLSAELADLKLQLQSQVHGRPSLERWLAAWTLHYAEELRGKDYSVILTAGPTTRGDNGVAITLVSHNDLHDATIVRAVYKIDRPPHTSWIKNRVDALHTILDA